MADLISMLAAVAGSGGGADPNFNQTVLLLHGDGTNGAQNNTFLDSSTNNFTITRNGNTTQGTFSPFSVGAGEWSNYFDGTGDRLELTLASGGLGSGNFTLEYWFYPTSLYDYITVFSTTRGSTGFNVGTDASGLLVWFSGGSRQIQGGTIVANQWHHAAFVRNGSTLTAYLNGTSVGTATVTTNFSATASSIGNLVGANNEYATGYISNLRLVVGTAVYTSNFTVPTSPLTAITNTSLLTCQSNRFIDNSTNNFTITRNGDVRVTSFSPFAPTAAYDAGTNGGSGYFDGSDDLTLADNAALELGSSSFCIEAWVYPTATPGASGATIIGKNSATYPGGYGFNFVLENARTVSFNVYTSGLVSLSGSTALPLNAWAHVAATRSGNNYALFVNGVREATSSAGGTVQDTSSNVILGDYGGGSRDLTGYISAARMVIGSEIYDPTQTTLSIPSAPPTNVTNTALLLNFTNAGIIDNTGKNNLETVGNAQIDTAVKKYGTGSLEFDGTGDYLLLPNNVDQQLGTGNFTIEFWVYLASGDTGSARGLVAKGTSTTGWLVSLDSSEKVVFTYTTSTITSTGAITTNAWNYIAVVREGTGSNQTKIYIGGVNDGTGTVSTDFNQTSVMYIGANRTGGDPMKGFIDDLRITKGIARTITVPTAAFPDL